MANDKLVTVIMKMDEKDFISDHKIWEGISPINIDNFPWNENNYMPRVEAKICYTDSHFHVYFKVYEKKIRAVYTNMNDPVCRDSCVEFFFNPNPEDDDKYLNFEINVIGNLLLGLGRERSDRVCLNGFSPELFKIQSSVSRDKVNNYNSDFWTIEYSIPFTFIEKYYGKVRFVSGQKIAANFYKCGDDTEYPHYGCWNPIVNEVPDFHRPEFFGTLILE